MSQKVVVIGSNGLLGQTLINKLATHPNYQVYAMASGENRNNQIQNLQYKSINIADFHKIDTQLKSIAPDFIINAIAMTNVDACEVKHKTCDQINVHFVADLARTSKEIDAHLIHISTDFVFDGLTEMYRETDKMIPVNYYGLSKLKSEIEIQNIFSNYTILRTILVYGKVDQMKRSNIVLWVKESLEKGKKIYVINDQFRMPTYVGSVADACILSMDKKAVGVYHISGKEYLSIIEIAQQVAEFYQLPKDLIKPITSIELNQKATRPP
jgi:dTDP-4-dehydrorhamnose reductase